MKCTIDLIYFLKIRAKDLNHMRDITEHKIHTLPNIVETELMTVLKTKKEEHIVSVKKDMTNTKKDYF
jgi:Lrp/AsnC family transcriptional regulator, regulator for asnA, asnC and gidA